MQLHLSARLLRKNVHVSKSDGEEITRNSNEAFIISRTYWFDNTSSSPVGFCRIFGMSEDRISSLADTALWVPIVCRPQPLLGIKRAFSRPYPYSDFLESKIGLLSTTLWQNRSKTCMSFPYGPKIFRQAFEGEGTSMNRWVWVLFSRNRRVDKVSRS